MAAGALLLIASAVFATKANKKFAGFTTATLFKLNWSVYIVCTTKTFTTVSGLASESGRIYANIYSITDNHSFIDGYPEANGNPVYWK